MIFEDLRVYNMMYMQFGFYFSIFIYQSVNMSYTGPCKLVICYSFSKENKKNEKQTPKT